MSEQLDAGARIVICRITDRSCRPVTKGFGSVDGTDERSIASLGAFRPIDVLFDVSREGRVVRAPYFAG